MAHNVVIRKVPRLAKDGHVLAGKYNYFVRCKRCGDLHEGKLVNESLAKMCETSHHIDARMRHSAKQPHEKRMKSGPTGKRGQKKMVKLRG